MIIESQKYSGRCTCGQDHVMTTEFCIIDAGCMSDIDKYISRYGLSGFSVAIYDENTYCAEGLIRPTVNQEIILSPQNLHADNNAVDLVLAELSENCDYLIAVGSGTIHDITRYCAYQLGVPFVSCPTAASVDGFCSSVSAMTWYGFKKTLTAVAPKIVVADLNVISKAPSYLAKSGFGDMVGKFVALADWKVAHIMTDEYFCNTIHDMTMDATRAVVQSADGIRKGNIDSFEKLTYGLLMSGLAMQLLGNSRCASGAEHHISHLIEMKPEGLGGTSNALHGEKVGVGTLLACKEYHDMRNNTDIRWSDYKKLENEYIQSMFGDALSKSIITENYEDVCCDISAEQISSKWNCICDIIREIPTVEELKKVYDVLGVKATLSEIDFPEEKLEMLLEYSPLVRNRLTLMRLRRAMIL